MGFVMLACRGNRFNPQAGKFEKGVALCGSYIGCWLGGWPLPTYLESTGKLLKVTNCQENHEQPINLGLIAMS